MGTNAKRNLAYSELGSFFENMGMMVRAGISVAEGCELLKEETAPEDAAHGTLETMCAKMEEGAALEDAMGSAGTFPEYAVDMVKADGIKVNIVRGEEYQIQKVTLTTDKGTTVQVDTLNRGGGRLVLRNAVPSLEKAQEAAKKLGIVVVE